MKVALVCDWLTNVGGAEKVLLKIHRMYPEAPIYTSQYNPRRIDWFLDADVRTGWLRIFPAGMRRFLGPLRQRWFSRLDLSEYDLVISVTGAEAKAVTASRGVHISYCHVPTQYYWQMYDEYVKNPGFGVLNPVVRFFFKALVKPLKRKDFEAAQRVDAFVTISEYAKEMIGKYYKREAKVIHPPVEVDDFKMKNDKSQTKQGNKAEKCQGKDETVTCGKLVENFSDYYVVTSRQVNWKRLDLAVKACVELKRNLVVIGEGPEHQDLVKMARGSECIAFVPLLSKNELKRYLAEAKGYLFPSLEPFGIAPIEALAAGCPVIAYGEGGALDYVVDGENGVFFDKQTVKSLKEAILKFEGMKFDTDKVVKSAEKFGVKRFDKELGSFIEKTMRERGDDRA